jgi:YHS domain-containing protein
MVGFFYRLILFLIAISVLRAVIQAVVRAFQGNQPPGSSRRTTFSHTGPSQTSSGGSGSGEPSASTLLHQDPVCGTYVAAASSLRKISGGKVYHFCSEECRDRFSA